MAANELGELVSLNNTTPIQYLHALWERANAAYNVVDEAAPSGSNEPADRVKASWFNDGTSQLYTQAGHLQMALLNEVPQNMIDATILAGHICTHGSGIDTLSEKYREQGFAALDRAVASLFAFMAQQTAYQFDGWMGGTLRGAMREVTLREGRPEAWDALREAA